MDCLCLFEDLVREIEECLVLGLAAGPPFVCLRSDAFLEFGDPLRNFLKMG